MPFQMYGQYGPEAVFDSAGHLLPGQAYTVYEADGQTIASLYSAPNGTAVANPTTTDQNGNASFFAAPAHYVVAFVVGGVTTTLDVVVRPDPEEYDSASGDIQSVQITQFAIPNPGQANLPVSLTARRTGLHLIFIDLQLNSANGSQNPHITLTATVGGTAILPSRVYVFQQEWEGMQLIAPAYVTAGQVVSGTASQAAATTTQTSLGLTGASSGQANSQANQLILVPVAA